MLALTDLFRESVIRRMIDSLEIPRGGVGLDAGCGIGSCTDILLESVGNGTRVIGIDFDIETLRSARSSPDHPSSSFICGNIERLPFADHIFDWVLSVDCIGMMPKSTHGMITELIRVVRPGGMLALAAWTSQLLLPGHPRLEAQLNATSRGIDPFRDDLSPSLHFLRLRGQLEAAGLDEIHVQSFLGEIHPPRNETEKQSLASLFFMRWGCNPRELPDKERFFYRSLIDPESDQCIYHQSDYYALFIYTLFTARTRGK